MNSITDRIIVIGAGLAGSSIAGLLAHLTNKKIVILERSLPAAITDPSPNSRPISMSYATQAILETVGWWEKIRTFATPIESVEVSQAGHLGSIQFDAASLKVPNLGYSVPYDYLHQALYEATCANEQVHFLQSDSITDINSKPDGISIAYTKGREACQVAGHLLIAADGTQSDSRTKLAISHQGEDTGNRAITGELTLAAPHENRAYQRFTQLGIVAVLPLPQQKRARFVLSLSAEQAQSTEQWRDRRWLDFFQKTFRGRLLITETKRGGSFPIQTQLATQSTAPHTILFGNAAHTLFPLAAQGFNLTMRDGAALVELLCQSIQANPNDYANASVLNEYATWREKEAAELASFTQGLDRLFSNPIKTIAHGRSLGLLSVDACSMMKASLGRKLLGLGGRVPELSLGILPVMQKEYSHA